MYDTYSPTVIRHIRRHDKHTPDLSCTYLSSSASSSPSMVELSVNAEMSEELPDELALTRPSQRPFTFRSVQPFSNIPKHLTLDISQYYSHNTSPAIMSAALVLPPATVTATLLPPPQGSSSRYISYRPITLSYARPSEKSLNQVRARRARAVALESLAGGGPTSITLSYVSHARAGVLVQREDKAMDIEDVRRRIRVRARKRQELMDNEPRGDDRMDEDDGEETRFAKRKVPVATASSCKSQYKTWLGATKSSPLICSFFVFNANTRGLVLRNSSSSRDSRPILGADAS